jgi:hypothetical protein
MFLTGATGGVLGFAAGAQLPPGQNEALHAQTPTAPAQRPMDVSVRAFGAKGDGRADDTAAIQSAIDAVAATGGVVRFEYGRYLVTSTLRVRSVYPVSLVGEMMGQMHTPAGGAALLVGRAMDFLIEYAAPNATARGDHGAGAIVRLAFVDPTSSSPGQPGSRTVNAALHLRDFALGMVEGCTFHWIRGGAILTDYAVMATVKGCRIRYCGDSARPGASAIRLGGSSRSYPTQSFLIDDCRIEVCYGKQYILAAGPCFDVAVRSCFFEAATTEYPASSNTFVEMDIDRYAIEGCTFNRTDAEAVVMRGRGKMVGCHFANGIGAATSLVLAGDRCSVAECIFEDNRTALSIDCTGPQCRISGNTFYYSGGVRMTGRGSMFSGNMISNPRMGGPGWWLDLAGRCVAEGNRFDGNGAAVAVGGIATRREDRVANNSFDRWTGQACIGKADARSTVSGNTFTDVGRQYLDGIS